MLNFREFCEISENLEALNEKAEWDQSYVEVGRKDIKKSLSSDLGKIKLKNGQTVRIGIHPYWDSRGEKKFIKIIKVPIRPNIATESLSAKVMRQYSEVNTLSKDITNWLIETDSVLPYLSEFLHKSLFSVFCCDELSDEIIRGVIQRNIDENLLVTVETDTLFFDG